MLPDGYELKIVKAMVTEEETSTLKKKYDTWFGKNTSKGDLAILVTNLLAALHALRMMGQDAIQKIGQEQGGIEAKNFMEAAKFQFEQQFGPSEANKTMTLETEEERKEFLRLLCKAIATMMEYMKIVLRKVYSQSYSVEGLDPGVLENCHAMWKMVFDMLDAPGLKIVSGEKEATKEVRRIVRHIDATKSSKPS